MALLAGMALFVMAVLSNPLLAEQPETGDTEVKLNYVTMNDMADYFTPKHKKKPLTSTLDLPNGESRGIRCNVTEQNVEVDTNLDGKPDTKISQSGKIVELTISDESGAKRKYAVMLWRDDRFVQKQWYYYTASAVSGVIEGKKFLVIDDNCNGKYNDFGEDAIIVAPSKAGWFLSSVLDFGKGLIEIAVEADGSAASYHPFIGTTGTVDALSKLSKANFKPLVFVVKNEDRSFNVIRPDSKPSIVPIGKYNIERAIIDRTIEVIGAAHPPFDILKDNTTTIEWGGPFTMLFYASPGPDYPRAVYAADPNNHLFYCEPPYIKGEKGEVYVGSKEWCEPEQVLNSADSEAPQKWFFTAEKLNFNIEILDIKTRKSMNSLKFYSAGQPAPQPSQPAPYYWLPFTWEYKQLRGNYLLRVTCPTSRAFKEAVYEEKIELK